LVVILAACGASATAVPAAKQAPVAPAAVAAPAAPAAVAKPAAPAAVAAPAAPAAVAAPAAPAAVAAPAAPAAVAAPTSALAKYAAEHAGKPGAIYAGDLKQMVGPAVTKDQGDLDGNVTLETLQRFLYVYESEFYKGLLVKANLTNPTPLVSTGQSITIQHACINRSLLPCKMTDSFMFPNVLARTKGQVKLVTSSYPELGINGPDTLALVADGSLSMSDIYSGFVSGQLPPIEIQNLWGVYPTQASYYFATAAVTPDIEKLVEVATGGGKVINHNWYSGNDQFFLTKKPLRTVADFKGMKTRSHGTALSDWIEGMGATAQFVAFAEVYSAMERGILEAAVTGGDAAYGQRLYEVSDYINGPLISWPDTNNVINGKVWAKIPPDLQQILIEEGAKSELEALRVGSAQNESGLLRSVKAGMTYVEFSPELKARSDAAVLDRVMPSWIKRVGGPDKPFIKIYNEKVAPLVGLRIEADGKLTKIPVVQGK
jgi:TRAP-type C4-dicarboxylate transport system substrate-binding protein